MSDRTPRTAQTREKTSRRKPWTPPSTLEAPAAPEGYKHRWIRESLLGQEDKTNMSKRIREGWEPVRSEDHPDFVAPTIEGGRNDGVIGVGGLVLAKIPEETADERNAYYRSMTDNQIEALDTNLMRESNDVMPIEKPNRSSKVTFGSGGIKKE
tara:strand:- start:8636 stop:9097 length:462 start_codon:yes stop_codon:yes gene_type:complete